VEAAVTGIVVFGLAARAHAKGRHSSGAAIVWNVLNNCVPGSAVGAVGEGIEVAAIAGLDAIIQTVAAGSHVGGNQRKSTHCWVTRLDSKPEFITGFQILYVDFGNFRQHRKPALQFRKKGLHLIAFGLDLHAGSGISDIAIDG
jgi:hypothetical protein